MIRIAQIIFCNGRHTGCVTYPDVFDVNEENFLNPRTDTQLRAEAKLSGWTYKNGRDLCDSCSELEAQDRLAKAEAKL